MCWLADEHPLVRYAREPSAGIVHLFNFVGATSHQGERADWVNQALFAELLSRVEGDGLESGMRAAVERGVMRPETHGSKPGFVVDRENAEVRTLLGEFNRLDGEAAAPAAITAPAETAIETPVAASEDASATAQAAGTAQVAATDSAVRKRTRRGSRGGRNRRGGRGRTKTTTSTGGQAAD